MNVLGKSAWILFGVAASGISLASNSSETSAAKNCARAEAQRLHVKVAGTRDDVQSAGDTLLSQQPSAQETQQMVVAARDSDGRLIAQMLCTYDDQGEVVSIHPVLNVVAALYLDQ